MRRRTIHLGRGIPRGVSREAQELLFSVLEGQGNRVSLDVMPGCNHISLSEEGWKVFLAAFPKAAARD